MCIFMLACSIRIKAASNVVLSEAFSDDYLIDAASARAASTFSDSFKSQMEGFELKVYKKLEQSIDFMRKNAGDLIEVDISGMPNAHFNNDEEMKVLVIPMFTAVFAFEYDHPELFWLSKYHAYRCEYYEDSKEVVKLYVAAKGANTWHSDAFPTYQSVVDAEKTFNDRANSIVAEATGKGAYESIKYFNKYIIDNCTYNPKVTAGQDQNTLGEMPWCAYSAMVKQTDESKFPVCEGYSKAFKVLCNKAGINCVLVPGNYKGQGHMWDCVRMINGIWFYVDPTFNDVEEYETRYFMRGQSMTKTHIPRNQLSGSCRPVVYPELSKYDYSQAVGDLLGDANKDGKVNTADAATVLRHAAEIQKITDSFAKLCADFNCDAAINTADAAGILRFCAGM